MNNLIKEILEWPIILQGALGSFLFWMLLSGGQKLTSFLVEKFSKYSKTKKLRILQEELLKLKIATGDSINRPSYLAALIYRALRHVVLGLIWLTLGFASEAVIPTFEIVGFLGALFYFFNALSVFRTVSASDDSEKRIKELEAEISEYDKS
jgi:hypothetical protein